jgi:Fe-S oxidoreductase
MCKGSWELGSACGHCSRCAATAASTIKHLRADLAMYKNAWQRELRHHIAPKTHLIDALVIGTRRLVENEADHGRYAEAVRLWGCDAELSRTLGMPEPSLLDYLPGRPLPTSAASQSAEGVPARSATDEQIALPQHRTSSDGASCTDIAACAFGDTARAAQKKSEGEL